MRLWSLHPRHLDRQGLTGCWRESLLAQAVLAGRTRGYRSHPQLERFRAQPAPLDAVGTYLEVLAREATARGYRFDLSRIDRRPEELTGHAPTDAAAGVPRIPVTRGQVDLEWRHLLAKLAQRSPGSEALTAAHSAPTVHPLFTVVPGPVESWERAMDPEG
ncbi:pyrimidine dimer DNA glycosylase/endonuclease V [Brachybacterium paraconglomeratum]